MEQLIIEGQIILMGEPEFIRRPFHDLQPNDKIVSIGKPGKNGKQTSSHRVDTWIPFITYKGIAIIPIEGIKEPVNCLLFKLPEGGVGGSQPGYDFYKIYGILDKGNLIDWVFGKTVTSVRLFSAHFKNYNNGTGKI